MRVAFETLSANEALAGIAAVVAPSARHWMFAVRVAVAVGKPGRGTPDTSTFVVSIVVMKPAESVLAQPLMQAKVNAAPVTGMASGLALGRSCRGRRHFRPWCR